MNKIQVVDKKVVDLAPCWNCRKAPPQIETRDWPTLDKELGNAGWKTRLALDFFNTEQKIVEYHQAWCTDCEEGSGPAAFVNESDRKFGFIVAAVILVVGLLSIGSLGFIIWWAVTRI